MKLLSTKLTISPPQHYENISTTSLITHLQIERMTIMSQLRTKVSILIHSLMLELLWDQHLEQQWKAQQWVLNLELQSNLYLE